MNQADTTLTGEINVRYAKESLTSCCLSCGGAFEHAKPAQGEVFVDLGSGRGLDVIKAARMVGSSGRAIGIDITEEMLQVAKTNRDKLKITNADFYHAPIDHLPLDGGSVNVVISNCTINHAKDKAKVYSEVYRILIPGGRVIVSDVIAENELPPEVVNDPKAWAACYGGAIVKDEYFSAMAAGGFKNVEILEESDAYEKGGVIVRSITVRAYRD